VLDRLVGYELSPVLWRKVRPSLSAGRVQSVSVRLIVEREREIKAFQSVSSFKVVAVFRVKDSNGKQVSFKALRPDNFKTSKQAESFLQEVADATFTVSGIEKKPGKKSPAAPFTTSTLQQEAAQKLGFSVSKTMLVAQKLYEAGFITYMRTDSVSLSKDALAALEQEISSRYGVKYHKTRLFKNKNESAQEAHEAIRPSYMNQTEIDGERDQQRLYDLIWKRTIASQMSDAEIERTIIDIVNDRNKEILQAKAEMIVFDGFLKVYLESSVEETENENEEEDSLIPPVQNGQVLDVKEITATERLTKAAARYTEASLVKKLEELGIGRPSTYAPTISTIQKRGYVVKETREGVERAFSVYTLSEGAVTSERRTEIAGAEKNKLFPTDIGSVVTDFLTEHFSNILDYHFTAQVEKQFDDIADGQQEWHQMIDSFYKPFHETIERTTKESKRVTGERMLGSDPASGEPISVRIGRFGPMVQIGDSQNEEVKPRYAKLRPTQSIETITLEEALELFRLPRILGTFEEQDIKVAIGRFGPYVQHSGKFVSLKKEHDPYTISLDEAIVLIQEKRTADENKTIQVFAEQDIQVLNGRYGPYLKKGKDNYKIPKDKSAAHLTLEDCLEIIGTAGPSKKRPPARGKKKG